MLPPRPILALVLALAAPKALAEPRTAPPRKSPASAPAAPLAAAPAPSSAPTAPAFVPSRLSGEPSRMALLAGIERADGESALKLRGDLERDLVALGPRARFGLVLSLGWVHDATDEQTVEGPLTTRAKATADRFELVPSFRFTLSPAPKVDVYADCGLGATYLFTSSEVTAEAGGLSETVRSSDAGPGAVLRFAAGFRVAATPRLRLGVEGLGLNFHYGEGRGQTITVLGTAAYRL